MLNETVLIYSNATWFDYPEIYPLRKDYSFIMPDIVDPDDSDIFMYFYKGFNDTFMTFGKVDGKY